MRLLACTVLVLVALVTQGGCEITTERLDKLKDWVAEDDVASKNPDGTSKYITWSTRQEGDSFLEAWKVYSQKDDVAVKTFSYKPGGNITCIMVRDIAIRSTDCEKSKGVVKLNESECIGQNQADIQFIKTEECPFMYKVIFYGFKSPETT